MIDHVWTVICARAVIDRDSNATSLESVLEEVTVWGEPAPDTQIPMPFDVMTTWTRSRAEIPARGRMRTTFVLPSGNAFRAPVEADIDLTRCVRYRQKIKFLGVPVAEAGRHVVRVEFQNEDEDEWRLAAIVPLDINFKPPQEVEG